MTLPVHRKVPVAVDSYESYGSSNVFTSRCRSVNIITDSLNAHGRMSIPRSTKAAVTLEVKKRAKQTKSVYIARTAVT